MEHQLPFLDDYPNRSIFQSLISLHALTNGGLLDGIMNNLIYSFYWSMDRSDGMDSHDKDGHS